MAAPRIFRTASFRFALAVALLFLLSGMLLGGFVYRSVSAALERQVAEQIDREMGQLLASYRVNGLGYLSIQVNTKQEKRGREALDYSLQGLRGVLLAGAHLPAGLTPGRVRIAGPAGTEPATLLVRTQELPGGETLVVGAPVDWIDNVQQAILTAFSWALALTAALALLAGLWLSQRFLARLDAMTRTAASIVAGDLSSRIPVSAWNDDFDGLARAFNTMLDRLGAAMESLRQVSNDIAHDLRTPLTRLRQTLDEATRASTGREDVARAFASAGEQVDDILATFSALLRIAQIESGQRRKGFAALDLAALGEQIAEDFRSVAEEGGQSLAFHGAGPVMIEGDRDLLTQAIVNLVENAIRHTPRGARIELRVDREGNAPRLVVADNGPGVPAGEREKIFDRFYRVESSRTTPGSGLGLALVAAIAELHGGSVVAFDNAPGLAVAMRFPAGP